MINCKEGSTWSNMNHHLQDKKREEKNVNSTVTKSPTRRFCWGNIITCNFPLTSQLPLLPSPPPLLSHPPPLLLQLLLLSEMLLSPLPLLNQDVNNKKEEKHTQICNHPYINTDLLNCRQFNGRAIVLSAGRITRRNVTKLYLVPLEPQRILLFQIHKQFLWKTSIGNNLQNGFSPVFQI